MKRILKKLIGVVVVLIITLAMFEVALRLSTTKRGHIAYFMNKDWNYLVPFDVPQSFPSVIPTKGAYRVYDPRLGWTIGKSGIDGDLYYSDANGHRCSRQTYFDSANQVTQDLNAKEYDIVCIGDSFTHGDEVPYEQTWPHYLSEQTGKTVLNLGVGGYGVDQAFLRYQYEKVKCKVVVLGLISGDLERATTQVYNLTVGGLKTKPMFVFQESGIVIANSPAIYGDALKAEFQRGTESDFFKREMAYYPEIVRAEFLDFLYSYRMIKSIRHWKRNRTPIYLKDDKRLGYCVEILKYIDLSVKENGADFVVVILDNSNSLQDRKKDRDPWRLLKAHLAKNGIKYIDCTKEIDELYDQDPNRVINRSGVHYTPEANLLVAKTLAKGL